MENYSNFRVTFKSRFLNKSLFIQLYYFVCFVWNFCALSKKLEVTQTINPLSES